MSPIEAKLNCDRMIVISDTLEIVSFLSEGLYELISFNMMRTVEQPLKRNFKIEIVTLNFVLNSLLCRNLISVLV